MKPNHFRFRMSDIGFKDDGRLVPIRNPQSAIRNAFTLVEMLVAVGLVVLMMTLFTTIFQIATGSLAKQKSLAEGDQRVRLVMTLLRGDLDNRTMKNVDPFLNSDNADPNTSVENAQNIGNRQGYFYIAENDIDDDTDDLLQFTVSVPPEQDPYRGAAKALLPDSANNYGPAPIPPAPLAPPNIASPGNFWRNQPEFDDQAIGYPDGASTSTAAEICWFLRNGTLYRRILLIRSPTVVVSTNDHDPSNYPTVPGAALSLALYESGAAAANSRNFYSHFDFSAHYDTTLGRAAWHGISDLNPTGSTFPLGKPNYRFGFNQATGIPREFSSFHRDAANVVQNAATDGRYFGRFTHEETSFINTAGTEMFGFPSRFEPPTIAPNPYSAQTTPPGAGGIALTYNVTTGKIEEYTTNTFIPKTANQTQLRIAEDVVMTNVLRFDVKVFDDGATNGPDNQPGVAGVDDNQSGNADVDATEERGWPGSDDGDFFDLGHLGTRGFYNATALNNTTFCPAHPNGVAGKTLFRFDTWHPNVDMDQSQPLIPPYDPPPFRAPTAVNATTGARTRRPLRAIQIKITFFDITSQTTRDVTFVQSLRATE